MKKPSKANLEAVLVDRIKPARIDTSKDPNAPGAILLQAVLPRGILWQPAPWLPRKLAATVGTQDSIKKSFSTATNLGYVVHVEPQTRQVIAIDSYPSYSYMAGLVPAQLEDVTTITVEVDPTNGTLTVDPKKYAPYFVSTDFPALLGIIDRMSEDEIRVDAPVGSFGHIKEIDGQKIIIELIRTDLM